MKKVLFIACTCLLTTTQLFAQDLTQNYRKLILNSSNSTSLFQSNSSNGVWASGMIATDRWGIFEDATTAKERFTILPGGNTGIGTNNPRSKLHVYKGNSGGNPHAFSNITVEDINNGMISILTPNNKFGYFGFADSEDDYVGGMEYNHTNDRMILRVNNHPHDVTIHSSGNVGIGTTTPAEKLHINGSIRGNARGGALRIKTNTGYIDVGSQNALFAHIYTDRPTIIFNKPVYSIANTFSSYNNDLLMQTKGVTRLVIDDLSGNVGIGTTSPDAKLTVKGNIHTNEVKVDLLGAVAPDYVFYKDYNLKTLQDVEDYIAQEGHLPNIPSAKTMETQGIKLKEMNLKLLEKIEELTLYTIDQEKRIKTLENQNDILKSQDEKIKRLEKKLMLLLNTQE